MLADGGEPFFGTAMDVKTAEVELRRGFVRKVYSILSVQLLLTTAVAALFQGMDLTWLAANRWILWGSVATAFAAVCAMTCCQGLARKFPINYLFLLVLTALEGVMVGFLSAMYTWQSVILAAGITMVIFLGLTAFAWTTSSDFTGMGVYLCGALLTLCSFGFALSILTFCGVPIKLLTLVYDLVGVMIFVLYIIYDTQLILGEWGGHECQFSVDDYVFASLALYLDIINLFLHILSLLGDRR